MGCTVTRLEWSDRPLGTVPTPLGDLRIRSGYGSGLATRAGSPPGRVWAVCDRGPNVKVKVAIARYGLQSLAGLADLPGAKVMPRPDLGPSLAELQVVDDRVELIREVRILGEDGRPIAGVPGTGSPNVELEPVFDLEGTPIAPDRFGIDSEGLAAPRSGGFWVGDEFGPALLRLDDRGQVVRRLVQRSLEGGVSAGTDPGLPAIAGRRQLNRGFEALALSADERWLFLAFQSPLAHPDEAAHRAARHVRIWRLDAGSGQVEQQYLYPLDPPASFERDRAAGRFGRDDVKVSEIVWLAGDALLVLERGSETTKLYRVRLGDDQALGPEHLDLTTRPTVEELSAGRDFPLPVLDKQLLFSTDDAPEIGADLEGMAILSPTDLLLVSDNDFGVEGAETGFWRVRFSMSVLVTGAGHDGL